MDMVTPNEHPDQLLVALRDRLGAAAVLVGTDVPARKSFIQSHAREATLDI